MQGDVCVPELIPGDGAAGGPVEPRGVKRKISLTRCDVCETEEAKYRCPSCQELSCSLSCVKRHKLQSGCSGVRDKTAFLPLSQFSEINLLNDYRYLEETARVADKPTRDTVLQTPPYLSFSKKLLKKNATAAKVNLKLLPRSFTRHMENTSIYIKVEKKLYWHLKLHFPQSSAEYTDKVPEDRVLQQILDDYIHPTESDPVKRQRLKLYVGSPPDELLVFLKSEQRRPGFPKYHELSVKKTLRENLMFRTILEYPELHVVLKQHRQEFLTKFPERRSPGQSSSPNESLSTGDVSQPTPSTSREDPEVAECPKHVMKKRKSMGEESELEEGEIRSEEEEEEDEDEQPVCSTGLAKVQNRHDDRSSAKEDDGGPTKNQDASVTDHVVPSSSYSPDKDMADEGDDDGHRSVAAQDPSCSHNQGEVNGGLQVAVDYHSTTDNQKVTMETNDQLTQDGRERGGDDGQVHGGENEEDRVDETAHMETVGRPSSSLKKNIVDDPNTDHREPADGQSASKEPGEEHPPLPPPPSHDPDGEEHRG